MPIALDLIIDFASENVAGDGERLQQDRHRVGLAMRRYGSNYLAGKTVIGGIAHNRPFGLRRRLSCRLRFGVPCWRLTKPLRELTLDRCGINASVQPSPNQIRNVPAFGDLGEAHHADLVGDSAESRADNLLMLLALSIVVAENENAATL